MRIRCLGIVMAASVAVFGGTVAQGANPVFYAGTGEYYQVVETHATWQQAVTASTAASFQGVPGRLATINSAGENNFIKTLLTGGQDSYWVGGYQDHSLPSYSEPAGGWRWITNEPFSYTNWRVSPLEPSGGTEDFLEILTTGDWNDLDSNSGLSGGYVIEYAPEPSTVGLLAVAAGAMLMRRNRGRR